MSDLEATISTIGKLETSLNTNSTINVDSITQTNNVEVTLNSASTVTIDSISSVKSVDVSLNPITNVTTEAMTPTEVIEFTMLPRGPSGKDATINGYSVVEIVAGENMNVDSKAGKITLTADDCLEKLEELTNSEIEDLLK